MLSEGSQGISRPSATSLGRSIGGWLRHFHDWTNSPAQDELKELLNKNDVMKELKFYVNYTMLMDTIQNFPLLLEEARGIFEKVRDLAATELKKTDYDDSYGLIHGDFWTGKYV